MQFKEILIACYCCGTRFALPKDHRSGCCPACGSKNYRPDGEDCGTGMPSCSLPPRSTIVMKCENCGAASLALRFNEELGRCEYICRACGYVNLSNRLRERQKAFPCSCCHRELPFNPEQSSVICPACGTQNRMPPVISDADLDKTFQDLHNRFSDLLKRLAEDD